MVSTRSDRRAGCGTRPCTTAATDTHGFAILDQLRAHFRGAASFLMDRDTLLGHRAHWTEEGSPMRGDLRRLTPSEAAVYDDIRTQ
jgi:hypothetical protein